jgi:hypothetical protein
VSDLPDGTPGYWLDVMYPYDFGHSFGGKFPLKISCDARWETDFLSQDVHQLESTGPTMHSEFFFNVDRDKADASFQYAVQQLAGWTDSYKGSQFFVRLMRGTNGHANEPGEINSSRLGAIGEPE